MRSLNVYKGAAGMGGRRLMLVMAIGLGAACTEGKASGAAAGTGATVTDSAVPIEEALRRFRAGSAEPAGLSGGAPDRETLVRSFVTALETGDTAALRGLVMGRDEFAWLYYPSTPMSRPPYELPPDLMWFQMQGRTERGASLLLGERAGAPLGYLAHTCGSERNEGDNRIFGHCVLRRLTAEGDTVTERLFGLILERGGVFKFVSYANTLD